MYNVWLDIYMFYEVITTVSPVSIWCREMLLLEHREPGDVELPHRDKGLWLCEAWVVSWETRRRSLPPLWGGEWRLWGSLTSPDWSPGWESRGINPI